MVQQIYQERDLPVEDLEKIGLAKNGILNLEEDDLKALLSGRRTAMLRLQNLAADGLHIPSLDAKLSLKQNGHGELELLLHPIYREAEIPQYLTEDEAQLLEKGEDANMQKFVFDKDGNPLEILIEFDKETNEFIITDTEKIREPDFVNGQPLTAEQKERYRKGKEVKMPDGTTLQYSGTDSKGIRSDKLALVASILVDGGMSYLLYKGLHALFGKKRDNENAQKLSTGYHKAVGDMQKQEQGNRQASAQSPGDKPDREYTETMPR